MKFKRRAEWVWIKGSVKEQKYLLHQDSRDISPSQNLYVYFRRGLTLVGSFHASPIFISADGRYELYINGKYAGRGPARCHPRKQYVDEYDINSFLKEGENVIAVLAHSYGKNMSWYEMPSGIELETFGCGGFFCQGDIKTGEEKIILDTGKEWLYKQSDAWEKDVPSGGTGYVEYFDFRKSPIDWNSSEFDDTSWEDPETLRLQFPLGGSDIVPFPQMIERDIPYLHEELISYEQLLFFGEVEVKPHEVVSDQLRLEKTRSLEKCRIEQKGCTFEILTTKGRGAVLLFDFGKIVAGRVNIELSAPAGGVIDIIYGERLTEDNDLFLPPDVPDISISQAHRIILREGSQIFQQFEMAGFRYLRLTFRNCSKGLLVKRIAVLSSNYPMKRQGSFECSDPLLNKVWEAGAYTVRMCSQDGFLDCPTREQRQWTGDVFVEALVTLVTERDVRLLRKFLRQVGETQDSSGMVMMATTCDLEAAKRVFIPDFALLWVLTAEKYFLYTGDLEIIRELFQEMVRLINWFRFYLDENDLLCDVSGWTFIDWSVELGKKGEVAVVNALFIGALNAVSSFALQLGYKDIVEEYDELAIRIRDAINIKLWDEKRGLYVDSCWKGKKGRVVSQHANAALIYFNIAPKERWDRIFNTILDEKQVKLTRSWRWDKERLFDPEKDIIMVQPFFSAFLLGALRKAGIIEEVLDNIRRKWGPMVEKSPTLWETWQLTETTSTCHGFSSAPTYFLSTLVLGVLPVVTGFKRFQIRIPLCDISWAKGTVPTPLGAISVKWERIDEKISVYLDIPEGLEGEVLFPYGFKTNQGSILRGGSHILSSFCSLRV